MENLNDENLEKMERLLDKLESELHKDGMDKSLINSIMLVNSISRAMDLYNIILEETCDALYSDGFLQYKVIVQKLGRGYKHQLALMLKYITKYFDKKSLMLTQLGLEEAQVKENEASLLDKSTTKKRSESDKSEYTLPPELNYHHRNSYNQEPVTAKPTTYNHSYKPEGGIPKKNNSNQQENASVIANAQNIIKIEENVHPGIRALVESHEFELFQKLINIPVAVPMMENLVKNVDQVIYQENQKKEDIKKKINDQEKEYESYLAEHEQVTKKLDEALNSKKVFENMQTNSSTENTLRQVLRELDKSKRRAKGVKAMELIDSEEEGSFEEATKAMKKEKAKTKAKEKEILEMIEKKEKMERIYRQDDRYGSMKHNSTEDKACQFDQETERREMESHIIDKYDILLREKVEEIRKLNQNLYSNKKLILELKAKTASSEAEKNEFEKQMKNLKDNHNNEHENANYLNEINQLNLQRAKQIKEAKEEKKPMGKKTTNSEQSTAQSDSKSKTNDKANEKNSYDKSGEKNSNEIIGTKENANEDINNKEQAEVDSSKKIRHEKRENNKNNKSSQSVDKEDQKTNVKKVKVAGDGQQQQKIRPTIEKVDNIGNMIIKEKSPNNISSQNDNEDIKDEETEKTSLTKKTKKSQLISKVSANPKNNDNHNQYDNDNLSQQNKPRVKIHTKINNERSAQDIISEEYTKNTGTENDDDKMLELSNDNAMILNSNGEISDQKQVFNNFVACFNLEKKPKINTISNIFHKFGLEIDLDLNHMNNKDYSSNPNQQSIKNPMKKIDGSTKLSGSEDGELSQFHTEFNDTSIEQNDITQGNQKIMKNKMKLDNDTYPTNPDEANHKKNRRISEVHQSEKLKKITSNETANSRSSSNLLNPSFGLDGNQRPNYSRDQNSANNKSHQFDDHDSQLSPPISTSRKRNKDHSAVNNTMQSYNGGNYLSESEMNHKMEKKRMIKGLNLNDLSSSASVANLHKYISPNNISTQDAHYNNGSLNSSEEHYTKSQKNSRGSHPNGRSSLPILPPIHIDDTALSDSKDKDTGTNQNSSSHKDHIHIGISDIDNDMIEDMYQSMATKAEMNPAIKNLFKKYLMNTKGLPFDKNDTDFEVKFEDFKEYVKKFTQVHKKCGESCIHLKRFFDKIGFRAKSPGRQVYRLPKTDLNDKLPDKLPDINKKSYL